MTKEELEEAYNLVCKGSDKPEYIILVVPYVGLVEIVNTGIFVDGIEAPPEIVEKVKEYLNGFAHSQDR